MTLQPPNQPRRYVIGGAAFEAEALAPGLYIVATPIGNLGDMTIRALATLAAADTVLCEDTRTTAKLMQRFGLKTPMNPYHEHNAAKVRPGILARLRGGACIALVSDAGMPLVSDPGYRLVAEAVAGGIPVTSCPGPSAVLSGLALSGLPTDRFAFFGFLPHKRGERRRVLEEAASVKATLIFFESPHRIVDTLGDVAEVMPHRTVAVARELTKLHEEVLRGRATEAAMELAARDSIKGEITLLIAPLTDEEGLASSEDIEAAITEALQEMPAAKAASHVARRFNLSRKDVYARILARKADG